jgi:hypothetical protein
VPTGQRRSFRIEFVLMFGGDRWGRTAMKKQLPLYIELSDRKWIEEIGTGSETTSLGRLV